MTDRGGESETAEAGRWQFNLKFLLLLTTFLAILLAISIEWGAVVTLIPLALLVVAQNRAGYCRAVQQGRSQLVLGGLVGVAFVSSFFLPALSVPPWDDAALGWEAAWYIYVMNYDLLSGNLRGFTWTPTDLFRALLFLAVGAANLLLVWLPLALFFKQGRSAWFAAMFLASISVFGFSLDRTSEYGSGYFVWALSFILVSAAFPIGRRLFSVYIGLMAVMVTWIIAWQNV